MKTRKIKLFGTVWKIIEVPREELCLGGEINGAAVMETQTIYIQEDMHPHRKQLTLLHELMHVLFDFVGLDLPEEKEEELVTRLEHGMLMLIQSGATEIWQE